MKVEGWGKDVMETHEFDVEIRQDGKVKVHIKGVKGADCMAYAELFQELVGPVRHVDHTDEYYQPPTGVRIAAAQKVGR